MTDIQSLIDSELHFLIKCAYHIHDKSEILENHEWLHLRLAICSFLNGTVPEVDKDELVTRILLATKNSDEMFELIIWFRELRDSL